MNWEILEHKAARSIDLNEEEVEQLLSLNRAEDLERLYVLANQVNERLNHGVVSFIHNMNVNYTNICEYLCTFCEFKKSADSKDAYILTFEDVKRKVGEAKGTLTEITFQGGLSKFVCFSDVLKLLRQIKAQYPQTHLHAFSPEEIDFYSIETGEPYETIVAQAKTAGMDSMCGTAAEVLDERIRRKICSDKISSDEWCEIIKTGHRLGLHSTATILFGHIEKPEHVSNHLRRIRRIQRETSMFTEFIPLLFMPDKTKLGRAVDSNLDRVTYAFKMIAVARLYFMNDIRNIQTSWVKLGWDNALKSLECGANDLSGTLYNENITREAGGENGEFVPLAKFNSEIKRIGKIPKERDTVYSFQTHYSNISEAGHHACSLH